jgi:hypothetical protein
MGNTVSCRGNINVNAKHPKFVNFKIKKKRLNLDEINKFMGAILIKADSQSNKILADLARKLGANVLSIKDEQFEDLALGSLMDSVKTNESVSRELIMKKLK